MFTQSCVSVHDSTQECDFCDELLTLFTICEEKVRIGCDVVNMLDSYTFTAIQCRNSSYEVGLEKVVCLTLRHNQE